MARLDELQIAERNAEAAYHRAFAKPENRSPAILNPLQKRWEEATARRRDVEVELPEESGLASEMKTNVPAAVQAYVQRKIDAEIEAFTGDVADVMTEYVGDRIAKSGPLGNAAWQSDSEYPTGAVVIHNGQVWRAQTVTKSAEPGGGDQWSAAPRGNIRETMLKEFGPEALTRTISAGQVYDMLDAVGGVLIELRKRVEAIEDRGVKYLGVWQAPQSYIKGSLVTCDGAMWHANRDMDGERPGKSDGWTLAVKSGRDGKDATR